MMVSAGSTVPCIHGQHQWTPIVVPPGRDRREQQCTKCGARGVWVSDTDGVSDAGRGEGRVANPLRLRK